MKRKRVGGEEQDAFSRRARKFYRWHPGQLRKVKRRAAKRERREAMSPELAAALTEALDATERGETVYLGSFAQYAEDGG